MYTARARWAINKSYLGSYLKVIIKRTIPSLAGLMDNTCNRKFAIAVILCFARALYAHENISKSRVIMTRAYSTATETYDTGITLLSPWAAAKGVA